eukprot:2423346-Amphidinium_carterae.1
MEESDIELLHHRAQRQGDEDAQRELKSNQKHMDKFDERLWQQLGEQDGKQEEDEECIAAWEAQDDENMKVITWKHFDAHRQLRHQWRKEQIEMDI